MLRYMLVVLLYAITYCMALHNETELSAHGLEVQQIIYIYGPRQWKIQDSSNLIEKTTIIRNDYLITSGIGAHKFHLGKVSWNAARKVCVLEGGQLAVINSISEEKILLRIMEENEENEAWLGIHDLYEEGNWNTITGEFLEATGFLEWLPGEPNNYPEPNDQNCGTLKKSGNVTGLSDRGCKAQFPFFCEIAH